MFSIWRTPGRGGRRARHEVGIIVANPLQSTRGLTTVELIASPAIEKKILVVRGRQVMLDEDLADLYGSRPGPWSSGSNETRSASLRTSCSS